MCVKRTRDHKLMSRLFKIRCYAKRTKQLFETIKIDFVKFEVEFGL